jgi:hypothetical protein
VKMASAEPHASPTMDAHLAVLSNAQMATALSISENALVNLPVIMTCHSDVLMVPVLLVSLNAHVRSVPSSLLTSKSLSHHSAAKPSISSTPTAASSYTLPSPFLLEPSHPSTNHTQLLNTPDSTFNLYLTLYLLELTPAFLLEAKSKLSSSSHWYRTSWPSTKL